MVHFESVPQCVHCCSAIRGPTGLVAEAACFGVTLFTNRKLSGGGVCVLVVSRPPMGSLCGVHFNYMLNVCTLETEVIYTTSV